MKTIFSILTLLLIANITSFSQDLSQEEILLSESILIQKSYHIDLPTYNKAVIIVRRLISETELPEQEIISVLDDMVFKSSYHYSAILRNVSWASGLCKHRKPQLKIKKTTPL